MNQSIQRVGAIISPEEPAWLPTLDSTNPGAWSIPICMYVGTKKFHKSESVWFNLFLPTSEEIHVYRVHEDSGTCQEYWKKTVQEYKELKQQQDATFARTMLYYTGHDLGMTTQEVDPNKQ